MDRILEPEIMDSERDALEYNRMDHRAVNQQFVDDALDFLFQQGKRLRQSDDPDFDDLENHTDVVASLIDFGTGTAQIPVELCRRCSHIRVMAIDMATSMLDLAIRNVDIAGFRDQIQLSQIDAKDTGLEDGMFDGLISNSIIHHIPNPKTVVEEMLRITREDGILFVRDLMRPESETSIDMLVDTYAGSESEYSKRLFKESLHASLSIDEIRDTVSAAGHNADHVNESSDRHWTWATVL